MSNFIKPPAQKGDSPKVQVNTRIDKELADWLEANSPNRGDRTAHLEKALRQYIANQ